MRVTLTIALAALLYPAATHAGTITLESDFEGTGVEYFYSGFNNAGGLGIPLGRVRMTGSGADLGPGIDGQTFEAYCVDILGPIFDPNAAQVNETVNATAVPMNTWQFQGPDSVTPPTSAQAAERGAWAEWLYGRNVGTASLDVDVERTAMQMALWNVLYDYTESLGTLSVSSGSGDFYVRNTGNSINAAVASAANAFLADLALNFSILPQPPAVWLQLSRTCDPADTLCISDVQDFMGPAGATTAVPEPGSLLLLTTGILGTLASRSRRRRN